MTRVTLLAAALMLAAPCAAIAQLDNDRLLADSNRDGKVSLAEYQTSRADFLMRADHDRNGQVSQAEWTKGAAMLRAEYKAEGVDGSDLIGRAGLFPVIDGDKNGAVTRPEIDKASAVQFAKYDGDKDGFVTRTEARHVARLNHAAK